MFDEECYKDQNYSDYGVEKSRRVFDRPELTKRPILAWGSFESPENKGINFVLVEGIGESYGDWFTLENRNSGLGGSKYNRPEPFAFSFTELPREITLIGGWHVYSTKVEPFNIEHIASFIENYN